MLIMLVAPAKTHFEEQAPIAGTKQSKQAGWQVDKTVRLANFVLCAHF
jgi:hypothetical protein